VTVAAIRKDNVKAEAGSRIPLGATWTGEGTNFSVFSEVAERVELCLFDGSGAETRVELPERTAYCWHGYLPGIGPGQHYGYRVHGPYSPGEGQRCNPAKLLLDPYAKAVAGSAAWREEIFGHTFEDPDGPRNEQDSAPFVPRSVVVDSGFDWGDDRPPRIALHDTVVYEAHVKGLTARHPEIPEEIRGTYAGLAHPAVLAHWKKLGVTAIELLPIHQFVDDGALLERGLHNYWGYNTLGFFAPHNGYAVGGDAALGVREFKEMVKTLHREGFEVLLDVVYNHTIEGNQQGPTLSLRGFDNNAYYRLVLEDRRMYFDTTGTGNSLNVHHPATLQLILDSLRYWVTDMHVDGFRFDLAVALGRANGDYDRQAAFFALVQQDPVLQHVKLIAEPWDLGENGYHVGGFPAQWAEWNGQFRDVMRDVWRSETNLGDFAVRFGGSPNSFGPSGRGPAASVNFITAHDGFTLRDLVSYNDKHNEANGDENHDGESVNRSWNCGAEGPTEDGEVLTLRARQQRNLLFTLLLAQGTPMLLGGDEMGRTQGGNNNGYCQDNDLSYFDWEHVDSNLLEWTSRLISLRREHPMLRSPRWWFGQPVQGLSELGWFGADGAALPEAAWGETPGSFSLMLGAAPTAEGSAGERFLLLFNLGATPVDLRLPEPAVALGWEVVVDTASGGPLEPHPAPESLSMPARSAQLARAPR
jgi:isoamylase